MDDQPLMPILRFCIGCGGDMTFTATEAYCAFCRGLQKHMNDRISEAMERKLTE